LHSQYAAAGVAALVKFVISARFVASVAVRASFASGGNTGAEPPAQRMDELTSALNPSESTSSSLECERPGEDTDEQGTISLALLGHSTGREAILRTTYPSLDPVEEAMVVDQVLLFQNLYRSKNEPGEGPG
jgi:hypothetical protein